MYISFLLPYNIRHEKAPFLWVFYKQLSSFMTSEVMYVGNEDYFLPPHNYQERWELSPASLQRQNYEIPTENVLQNLNKVVIESTLFKPLEKKYKTYTQIYRYLLTKRYEPLELALEKIIVSLIREQRVDAILSWCNMPSLQAVADKFNLKVIYNELGPIRQGSVFLVDLAYFDFSGVNGCTDAQKRYEDTQLNAESTLSHEEILSLIIQEDYLPFVMEETFPKYEVGIVLQVEDDSNILAYSQGLNSFDLINMVKEKFSKEDILIRPHPSGHLQYDKLGTIDTSKTSIEFIKKCRRIVTINSSVALEAILLKKPTYILGDSPISFLGYNEFDVELEKHSIPSIKEKLNFIFFYYLIPQDFIFEDAYYKFRLSNPTEEEIFQYHLNYLYTIKNISIKSISSMESMFSKQYIRKCFDLIKHTEYNNEILQEENDLLYQQINTLRREVSILKEKEEDNKQEIVYLKGVTDSMRIKNRIKKLFRFRKKEDH